MKKDMGEFLEDWLGSVANWSVSVDCADLGTFRADNISIGSLTVSTDNQCCSSDVDRVCACGTIATNGIYSKNDFILLCNPYCADMDDYCMCSDQEVEKKYVGVFVNPAKIKTKHVYLH